MRSDRFLLPLAVLFLFLQLLWLAAELQFIHIPWIASFDHKSNFPVVGSIVSTHNNTRRRSSEDIVWWDSRESESVHAYDALLTLKNSAMKIRLNNGTELSLSENTLVYIETIDGYGKGERIRIRFAHGSLRSKFGMTDGSLKTQTWEIDATKNSEIKIKALDSGKLEVGVITGVASASNGKHSVNVDHGEVVELDSFDETIRRKITDQIQWLAANDHIRTYTHQLPHAVQLKWKGPAKKIQINQSGKLLKEFEISKNQEQIELPFEEGLYEVRLIVDEKNVSAWLNLDVWRAPVIHLMSPLPRDRYGWSESLNYIWLKPSEVRSSQWQLSSTEAFSNLAVDIKTDAATLEKKGGELGKFYWRVIGYDQEGFEIPAPYANSIYFVPQPLAAPQLNKPELRRPAEAPKNINKNINKNKSGAALGKPAMYRKISNIIKLLIENAIADQGGPIITVKKKVPSKSVTNNQIDSLKFNWEKVQDADYYIVEISEKPDFRTTLVETEVVSNEFVWTRIAPKFKKIYWRVASAGKNKMGRFSPVEEIDLQKLKAESTTTNLTVAQTVAVVVQAPEVAPTQSALASLPLASMVPPAQVPKEAVAEVKKLFFPTSESHHWLTLSYESTFLQDVSGATFNLSGPVLRYGHTYDRTISENWRTGYLALAQLTTWKNVDSGLIVSGKTNLEMRGRFLGFMGRATSPWSYSMGLDLLAIPVRAGLENVSFNSQFMMGLGVWYDVRGLFSESEWKGKMGFTYSVNSSYAQAAFYLNLQKPSTKGWTWGPEFELDSLQGLMGNTSGARGILGVSIGY